MLTSADSGRATVRNRCMHMHPKINTKPQRHLSSSRCGWVAKQRSCGIRIRTAMRLGSTAEHTKWPGGRRGYRPGCACGLQRLGRGLSGIFCHDLLQMYDPALSRGHLRPS